MATMGARTELHPFVAQAQGIISGILVPRFLIPSGKGISGNEPEHLRLFNFQSFISFLKGAGFDVISGRKFGLYIPFVTRFFGALAGALDRDLPLSHPLNISLPETMASHFLAECRKPGQYSRLPAGGQGV